MEAQELNLQVWRQIKMGRDDRAVLIGKTGCGKTTLARFLIEDDKKPFSVVWNPKGSDSIYKWRHKHVTSLRKLYEAADKEVRRIIYTPDAYLAEDEATQTEFGYWLYEKTNRRVYLDEATSIAYNGVKVPRWLNALINRGRERGMSTMTATQRPSGVPSNVLSESEHWYIFQTILPQDRVKVEAITGISVEDQMGLEDHEFYYFNLSKGLLPRKLRLNLNGVKKHGGRARSIAV